MTPFLCSDVDLFQHAPGVLEAFDRVGLLLEQAGQTLVDDLAEHQAR